MLIILFISCNTGNKSDVFYFGNVVQKPDTVDTFSFVAKGGSKELKLGSNIRSMLQDKAGNYWFGTDNGGLYYYDGKDIILYTEKDGLVNDQVQTIQQDKEGYIWFSTGRGVSRFDGTDFKTYANSESSHMNNSSDKNWKLTPGDLWFGAGGGAYRFDGSTFAYLFLPSGENKYSSISVNINPYFDAVRSNSVYCTFKDSKGNLWFGTQTDGVCRYDGSTFMWLKDKGLSGPAVRAIFEDKNGNMWFGNNGYGVFRYDGKTLTNLTDEKGLGNKEFFRNTTLSPEGKPGTMARVWTINQDNNGDIWIGTIDAGAWRYDGKNLINYTTKDGLPGDAIQVIYKDKNDDLLFGTDGEGVFTFDGKKFVRKF